MLSAKPWKADAIVRLLLSVLVCMIAGSLISNLLHAGARAGWKVGVVTVVAFGFLAATLVLLRRGWSAENLLRQSVFLIGCFYGGFLLSLWAWHLTGAVPTTTSAVQMFIGVLSLQGAGLVLIYLFIREHHLTWSEAFGFHHRRRYALLLGLVAACVYLPISEGLQWVSLIMIQHLPWLHLKPEEQQAVQALRSTGGVGERVVLGTVTILMAPMAEEMLFRGILYPWGKKAGYPQLAFWGTSLLFAAVHAQSFIAMGLVFFPGLALLLLYHVTKNVLFLIAAGVVIVMGAASAGFAIFLPLFVLAVALTVLYDLTDNLLAPIAAHSLFNGLNFLKLYLAEGRAFLLLLLVLMVILIVALLLAFSLQRDKANG